MTASAVMSWRIDATFRRPQCGCREIRIDFDAYFASEMDAPNAPGGPVSDGFLHINEEGLRGKPGGPAVRSRHLHALTTTRLDIRAAGLPRPSEDHHMTARLPSFCSIWADRTISRRSSRSRQPVPRSRDHSASGGARLQPWVARLIAKCAAHRCATTTGASAVARHSCESHANRRER